MAPSLMTTGLELHGAGVIINYSHNDIAEEAIHLGNNATVFQAEVFAVIRTASHLVFAETKNKRVVINCDSQAAAIMALDNTKIKSKTTLEAVLAQRSAVFDSFYLSISEVVDDFSIFVIMRYINATGRLNPITEWED